MARKKNIQPLVLAVPFLLAITTNASAQPTWYVDNCGHDTWCDGGSSACWNGNAHVQTCAKKTIQAGMNLGQNGPDR